MIVISLTDCPPKVRGDLSQWLIEVNTGVYVGNLNARVRDELWARICKELKNGRATMVYSTSGEQKLAFRVHNTPWEVVDYEGLSLIRRPLPGKEPTVELPKNFSKAAQRRLSQKAGAKKEQQTATEQYCVFDLETTGLSPQSDEILEFGAVRVQDGSIVAEFECLVRSDRQIPETVVKLTGITEELRQTQGKPLEEALPAFLDFIGKDRLVCHNAPFDSSFLRAACKRLGISTPHNALVDTMTMARRNVSKVPNYRLTTLAEYFKLEVDQVHRGLPDSRLTAQVYAKLKELLGK